MSFLILLIIAHLLGDFVLQPGSWVRSKFDKGLQSGGFWKHIGVHALLLLLIGLIYPDFYLGLIIIAIGHTLIDAAKIYFLSNQPSTRYRIWAFFADQLAHLVLIVTVAAFLNDAIDFSFILQPEFLAILAGYIFITLPASSFIKILLSPYNRIIEVPIENEVRKTTWKDLFIQKENKIEIQQSLKNAGNYIGIIERLLVFTFIIIGQWSAVGFLITAKSVFRFGDLNQGKNRQFTEYVLIGTLLSFGMAIVAALLTQMVINHFI